MSIFDIQKDECQICTQLLLFLHSKWSVSKLCWIFISFHNCIFIEYPFIQKGLNPMNLFEPLTYSVPPQSYHPALCSEYDFVHICIAVGDPTIKGEVMRVINRLNPLSHISYQS